MDRNDALRGPALVRAREVYSGAPAQRRSEGRERAQVGARASPVAKQRPSATPTPVSVFWNGYTFAYSLTM
jgi:hypothetical protein